MSAPPARRGLFAYFVEHRTAAILLLVLMVLAGVFAGTKIRAQLFPDVVIEKVTVSVIWKGVSPREMDTAVVARLEPVLRAIEGVKEVTATAREGAATISLEFEPGWDMGRGVEDVKQAVDGVTDLPEDTEKPVIKRVSFSDSVTSVVISGEVPVVLLDRYATELKNRLFKMGVTKTEIKGVTAPNIQIDVRPAALERYKLTLQQVATAVSGETGTQPVGQIDDAAARIRTNADRRTAEEIGAIAVKSLPDGTKLRLREIATVRHEGLDREVALYKYGKPAVELDVDRDALGDTLAIRDKVVQAVAALRPTLPQGVEMGLARTRAQHIEDRIDLLVRNGLFGLAIVLVLLFLFLSARTAFWVAAGIPIAMAATIGLMYALGLTLNVMSLFALIISLGIVVDDAIVVGEHADDLARRGLSPADAATNAARRMAAPVFAASITTIIAFFALTAIGGRFGRFVVDLPITVAVVVAASLIECFFILPDHMRHALSAKSARSWIDAPSRAVNRGFDWFRERLFRPLVATVIRLRYPVIAATLFLLAISVSAVMDRTVRWTFFSAPERGVVTANIAMLPSAKRADTMAMLKEMDRALKVVNDRYAKQHGRAPVKLAMYRVGGTAGRRGLTGAATKDADLLGGFQIELIDPDARPYSAFAFIAAWRAEIKNHALLETLALRGERSGPGGDAIYVRLTGADSATLKAAAEAVKQSLARYPAASGVEDSLSYDKPELVVQLTPKGEALGFTTASIARALRQQLDGIKAVTFAENGREVEVRVRIAENKVGRAYLHEARIANPNGGYVHLNEVATIKETQGFASIRRENGERVVIVTGDLSDNAAARDEVMGALTDQILPGVAARYGVSWALAGLAEQERDFLSDAMLGFLLGLVGIYLVLAWIFGSLSRPLVVMLVIPFGLIGAIWGHYFHGVPMTMFSIIGFIGMAGIIINDSIVLITSIDERAKGEGIRQAIVNGAAGRLRAVVLTSLTTVGGLGPMLFEQSRAALFLKPTVVTLAYGLGFGMVLVLLVTPALVAIQADIRASLRSARRLLRLAKRRRPPLSGPLKPAG